MGVGVDAGPRESGMDAKCKHIKSAFLAEFVFLLLGV